MSPEQLEQVSIFKTIIPAIDGRKFRTKARKKLALFIEQDGLCCLCSKPMVLKYGGNGKSHATFEHVICKSSGGKDNKENVPLSHGICNSRRLTSDFNQYKDMIKNNNGVPPILVYGKSIIKANEKEEIFVKAKEGDMNAIEYYLALKLEMAMHLFKYEIGLVKLDQAGINGINRKLERNLDFGAKASWALT